MGCDRSLVDGLEWVPYTRETEEAYWVDAHELIRMENHRDVSVLHQEVVVPVMTWRFTRADAEVAYHFYR